MMKKGCVSVFRPWDDSAPLEGAGGDQPSSTLNTELLTEQQHQLLKREVEEEEEELEDEEKELRRGGRDGCLSSGGPASGLESGLALAMRGLVGAAARRGGPPGLRWNLGGCFRGLMMGGPQPRPPLLPAAGPSSHRSDT